MAYEFGGDHMAFDGAGAFHHHQQQQNQQAAFNGAALPAQDAFAPQAHASQAPNGSLVHNGPPTPPNHTNAFQQHQAKQQPQHAPQQAQSIVTDFSQNLVAKAEPSPPEEPQPGQPGAGSGDDDLTPAQSRRKAQNRAAYVVDPTPAYPPANSGTASASEGARSAQRVPCLAPMLI